MKIAKISLISTICIFVYGCAFGAKMENMVYRGSTNTYDKALNNNIKINSVYGGERTSPVGPPGISDEEFYGAIKKSLDEQGLFSESGRYQLEIIIAEIDQPSWGADMTVATYVQYILTDKSNNSVVFDEIISASYTVAKEKAFAGSTRIRLANEGSGKRNIQGFLSKLSTLELNTK